MGRFLTELHARVDFDEQPSRIVIVFGKAAPRSG